MEVPGITHSCFHTDKDSYAASRAQSTSKFLRFVAKLTG